jgi:hypothetical protein
MVVTVYDRNKKYLNETNILFKSIDNYANKHKDKLICSYPLALKSLFNDM